MKDSFDYDDYMFEMANLHKKDSKLPTNLYFTETRR